MAPCDCHVTPCDCHVTCSAVCSDDMRSENCRLKTLHSQLSVDSVTSRGIFMAGTMSGSEGYGTMGTVGNETVEVRRNPG